MKGGGAFFVVAPESKTDENTKSYNSLRGGGGGSLIVIMSPKLVKPQNLIYISGKGAFFNSHLQSKGDESPGSNIVGGSFFDSHPSPKLVKSQVPYFRRGGVLIIPQFL